MEERPGARRAESGDGDENDEVDDLDADLKPDALAGPAFQDEVLKEIISEAPPDSWHHPVPGDVVTLEARQEEADGTTSVVTRMWSIGDGAPFELAGSVSIDRCARTMRQGEIAKVRAKGAPDDVKAALLRMVAVERKKTVSDLPAGQPEAVRTMIVDGRSSQRPIGNYEMLVRFGWREVSAAELACVSQSRASSGGDGCTRGETVVFLSGPTERAEEAMLSSRDLASLRRALLRKFGGSVVVEVDRAAPASEDVAVLRVARRSDPPSSALDLLPGLPGGGVSPAQACVALDLFGAASGGEAAGRPLARREPREIAMIVRAGCIECNAEDWIPGRTGIAALDLHTRNEALCDMRAGARCLVLVPPELAFGDQGCEKAGVPAGATLEYEVEISKTMALEDVSLDGRGGVIKKIVRDGEGYEKPLEGADVLLRLEAFDDASGAQLLEERELSLTAAGGKFCLAVDETVLTMKKGEACEVRCSDVEACTDEDLGLRPTEGSVAVLRLELLEFGKVDLYGAEEPLRVGHCGNSKAVGTQHFQAQAWRRALKRYRHVTATLSYLEHWKDPGAVEEATAMRKACHLNSAACLIKLSEWREAVKSCNLVLKDDRNNVKALFRRAQCQKELENYREAEQDVKQVLQIDRENKEAARLLLKLRELLKEEKEQQKEMMSRMARGIKSTATPADAEPPAASPPPQAEQAGLGAPAAASTASAATRGGSQEEQEEQEALEDDADLWWSAVALSTMAVVGAAVAGVAWWRRRGRGSFSLM